MSRHPYTFAADFIRAVAGYNEFGTKLSRYDASQIRQAIAKVIGMDDHELACKLSDAEQSKSEEDHERQAQAYLGTVGIRSAS
jgi:hypothetical protein